MRLSEGDGEIKDVGLAIYGESKLYLPGMEVETVSGAVIGSRRKDGIAGGRADTVETVAYDWHTESESGGSVYA